MYHIVVIHIRICINSLHLLGAYFVPGTVLSGSLLVLSCLSSQQPYQVGTTDISLYTNEGAKSHSVQ